MSQQVCHLVGCKTKGQYDEHVTRAPIGAPTEESAARQGMGCKLGCVNIPGVPQRHHESCRWHEDRRRGDPLKDLDPQRPELVLEVRFNPGNASVPKLIDRVQLLAPHVDVVRMDVTGVGLVIAEQLEARGVTVEKHRRP